MVNIVCETCSSHAADWPKQTPIWSSDRRLPRSGRRGRVAVLRTALVTTGDNLLTNN